MSRVQAGWLALLFASSSVLASSAPATRSGADILQRFNDGRADADCSASSPRWRRHYAEALPKLARRDGRTLALFGYVLDQVLEQDLPSEFALIPFVESRYRADARSSGGPAGLWQFTAPTARRHGLAMRGAVDDRMSVVASTRAATAYLARLHRQFGGQWRQTVMAYNAGEGTLRAHRRDKAHALPGVTRSYPEKLHAIACLLEEGGIRDVRANAVPRLVARWVPPGTRSLRAWAMGQGLDTALVAALNPGWHVGSREVLAPVGADAGRMAPAEAN